MTQAATQSTNVRNLEQIQEHEPGRRSGSRFGALLLASLSGAALVVVGITMSGQDREPQRSEEDPLASLVADAKRSGVPAEALSHEEVTFPGLLSDEEQPTTALAAVKDERGRLVTQAEDDFQLPPGAPTVPPPATDRLPVVPLPAGTLLNATAVTTEPKDPLTELSMRAAEPAPPSEPVPPGADSGYQLQVASFKEQADADKFVAELRKRGHQAFRVAAMVPERGLWHRVRIGPFDTKFKASLYKKKFEKSERIAGFVVDPDKVKQAAEVRASKLAARERKYGRP